MLETSCCCYANIHCRLAQLILAREDPQETFLKSIPKQLASLSITYPVMQAQLHDRYTSPVQDLNFNASPLNLLPAAEQCVKHISQKTNTVAD